ncbi:mechanosensitive ion channel family protein [Campylobacter iguaniorum]|uniref:Mechanosensitive ion channel family protein n=1 Tax=Campylobacter iguaniorum TaxID=1244531 RepID=A0A076FDH5_9BACT|nr:mechanosensitive ion channel family protein [Campylobacter iguaniorum]AII15437.1 mechanosensitive ion channel family protein [Campylobacter iguaniorum]ALV25367.1 mechanosensitive ion channel family protein [Campylobacter iguaniorum]
MTKFITKFLLIFSICLSAYGQDKDKNLIDVITEIKTINHQILIIKDQNKDKNGTNQELDAVTLKKQRLLESISVFITNYSKADIKEFDSLKQTLDKRIKNYQEGSNKYIQTKIEILSLEIKSSFYNAMLSLSNAFKANADQSEINSILQNGIISVQTDSYHDLKALKDSLSETNKSDFSDLLLNLDIQKQTYEEILSYLSSHSDLLASNFLFSSLNLKVVINYINELVPFDTNKFNFGKFILIIAIFVFFISLRKSLSKIIFVLFTIFLHKEKIENQTLREQFISIIRRPISVFLIAYSVDVCLSVFFYPSPVPIRIANLFVIIYIVLISWLFVGMLDGYGMVALSKLAQKSGRKEVVNLIIKILYFIIIIIAILMILSRLGFDISTLIASLGIGGLAVALATKDIIANFFASILLLFDNSFSQGDWIVCAGVEGTVVEVGLRKTTIRTFDNSLVFVPNSKIMSENVKNWNRRKIGRQIKMSIGLTYSSTPAQIKECINEIKTMLQNHPGIAKSGEDSALNSKDVRLKYKQNMVSVDDLAGYKSNLFVVLDEFGDNSINILIYCFSKTVIWGEFLETKQDVMLKIMDILSKYEVDFAFPSQSLYIEKLPKIEYDFINSKESKNA